ncbi:MAG TPA: hypothetical protein ENJ89_10840 [Caldithrix abyssi]|uniref:DUF4249 family protein n=1 Tax=Caldithrix abyssi TaxID=187145 RepID=A0A7V5UFP3_CALAY|nr:hypothetical protein [Caldithrix abyssi]
MRLLFLFLAAWWLIFPGCGDLPEDSPLSDIVIDDASVIQPMVELTRSINDQGSVTVRFEVRLRDKNGNYIKLKDGGVQVNGFKLGIKYDHSAPYYQLLSSDSTLMKTGQLMTVLITLGDGSDYALTGYAPPKALKKISAPDSVSRNNNIVITWQEVDSIFPQEIELKRYFKTSEDHYSNATDMFKIESPEQGRYFIYSPLLQEFPNTYKIIVKLISTRYGKIPKDFRSGGYFHAMFTISKIVKIY